MLELRIIDVELVIKRNKFETQLRIMVLSLEKIWKRAQRKFFEAFNFINKITHFFSIGEY
ncbi:hypothetical protein BpHYR1_010054 [Brachionus plicatilis]|uniref:Uncharacterized protein n=1 Tax=Brachionus plicatilis TaxID=10195 RepID=A0A3M7R9D5_BRAPC|nr:hypothetical protein BpHYR1_010054 [Brachionus plicatilis]